MHALVIMYMSLNCIIQLHIAFLKGTYKCWISIGCLHLLLLKTTNKSVAVSQVVGLVIVQPLVHWLNQDCWNNRHTTVFFRKLALGNGVQTAGEEWEEDRAQQSVSSWPLQFNTGCNASHVYATPPDWWCAVAHAY